MGAQVLILDTDQDGWVGRKEELSEGGRDLNFVAYDAAATDGIDARIAALEDAHGPIDAWINAAYPRTTDWAADVENLRADSWRENVDMQLNAVCLTCNAVATRMAARGGGAIINLSSIYGCGAPDFGVYDGTEMIMPPAYAVIKAGINNYSRYLASYWGGRGVRVNAICPGSVNGPRIDGVIDKDAQQRGLSADAVRDVYLRQSSMRVFVDAVDVAEAVRFLCSPAGRYISGQSIGVDGHTEGLSNWLD